MSGQKLMNAQRMLTTAMLRLFALILLDRFPAPATQGIQGMENSVQVRWLLQLFKFVVLDD